MSNISFTDEQFRDLLEAMSNRSSSFVQDTKPGSFAACKARFDGSRDATKVEAFVSTIVTYKKIEKVSDEDALEGLSLLLTGDAAIWWIGIKAETKAWEDFLKIIRTTFAPKKPAYKIYEELVTLKQETPKGTELFVAKKRALMAELPKPALLESQCLDLLYTSLHMKIKDKIPRDTVKSFEVFLSKARQIEDNLADSTKATKPGRCTECHAFGHSEAVCRRKLNKEKPATKNTGPTSAQIPGTSTSKPAPLSSKVACYGCGEPGVVRSKCTKCNPNKVGSVDVEFYSLNASLDMVSRRRPTVKITINGVSGNAHIDTGAKLSVASTTLHAAMVKVGVKFTAEPANVILADGKKRSQIIQRASLPVQLCGRIIPTNFIVLPASEDNRTLLGVDFIQDANMILNLPQLLFHFLDDPARKFSLENEEDDASVLAKQVRTKESVLAKLAKLTALEPMVSPISVTPTHNEVVNEDVDRPYGPLRRIAIPSPPPTSMRREAHYTGYSPRFVDFMYQDAQMHIENDAVMLSPRSRSLFNGDTNLHISTVAAFEDTKDDDTAVSPSQLEDLNRMLERNDRVFKDNGKHSIAIGAVLVQGEGHDEHPVEYASRLNFIPEVTPKLILLADTWKRAKEESRKKREDEHRRPTPAYQPGDLVMVTTHSHSNSARHRTAKFAPRRDGPYTILHQHGPCSFEVANRSEPERPMGIYHSSALSPYKGSACAIPNPERPMRRRGRPRKQTETTGLLAEASSGPEGETVTFDNNASARTPCHREITPSEPQPPHLPLPPHRQLSPHRPLPPQRPQSPRRTLPPRRTRSASQRPWPI